MSASVKQIRCAIYTRKSSEEGLEQSFNSLHAQREACEAYVLSQKHEGWQVIPTAYDDGGFSGGNMERPGLKKILGDIAAGKVDTVVVYKVDRLTRSLSDFARIVDSFDGKGVSFVSVTQQFNTTSSMGRLTLNVLLSFAQFEREVTGERIRDKVAASKRKGMWMGGGVPLGYDHQDGRLIINEPEARTVRMIFSEYLRLGSVFDLREELIQRGVTSKHRICTTGRVMGGAPLSRGTLYHLISNPLYIGKISHRGKIFDGLQEPIIDAETWKAAVDLLQGNRIRRITSRNLPSERPLLGLLFHDDGERYVPTHASKKGRRYAYYVAPCSTDPSAKQRRLPADEVEEAVRTTIRTFLSNPVDLAAQFADLPVHQIRVLVSAAQHRAELLSAPSSKQSQQVLRQFISRATIGESGLSVNLDATKLRINLLGLPAESELPLKAPITLSCAFQMKRRGSEVRIVLSNEAAAARPVASLSRAIALSRDCAELIALGKVQSMEELVRYSGHTKQYVRKILGCAVLSPQITTDILDGRYPVDLTVSTFTKGISADWNDQRL